MSQIAIKVENVSKLYQLGEIGTGTLSKDLNRWWASVMGREDPYSKVGQANHRTKKAESDFVWALKDINFEVTEGEVLGIIGKNGAGKSTLLKILSKITSPTVGKIYTKGRIASLLEVGTGFHPEMTGRENIYLNGAILGMRKFEIDNKFDEIVDFAGVQAYIDTPVKRYSSGMYVRLAFAVAAFLEPEILIVDEVLAVGDAEFQKKCLGRMKDVSVNEGRTVLFVSHNMDSIRKLCTKTILLDSGNIKKYENSKIAIEEYYMPLSKNAILGNNGVFDLSNHANKRSREFGLQKVVVYCNNTISALIQSGSRLKLHIYYNSERDLYSPEIGFMLKDINHNSLIGLNNKHLGIDLNIAAGQGEVEIIIDDFPFYENSTYWINLYFGDINYSDYEILENAIQIQVQTCDYFNSGMSPDIKLNKYAHKNIKVADL